MSRAATGNANPNRPFIFALAPTLVGGPLHTAPLQRYLEGVLQRPVQIATPENYPAAIADLRTGRADAAMLGAFATRKGAELGGIEPLVAQVGENEEIPTYRSAIVTRIDTGIRDIGDLRDCEFGLVDEQSTSGYLVPRAMLREAGLDPDTDVTTRLLGRHRHVVEAIIAGEVMAGAAHEVRLAPPSLERGPDYARLRVIARSRPIPVGPLVIRSTLDRRTRDRLSAAMIAVHETDPIAADTLIRHGHRFTIATRTSSPTLKSIAALAGVSYATVSRVVNGSGYVAEATANRVKAIVAEVGYAPNGNARMLQGQQAPIVGLVTPFAAGNPGDLVARLARARVPLVLCPVDGTIAESPFLQLVRDRRLGALVVGQEFVADPDLAELARTGHAIVAIVTGATPPGMIGARFDQAGDSILRAIGWIDADPIATS